MDYYLIPVGDFNLREEVAEEEQAPDLLDDFKLDTTSPVVDSEEVPQAEGKPSDYRNKFMNRSLTGEDTTTPNTANLSSLMSRKSSVGPDGKEQSFEQVSF